MAQQILNRVGISTRLMAIVGLALLGIVALQVDGLTRMRQEMLEDHRARIENLVESAHSLLAFFHAEATAGRMSDAAARDAALRAISTLSYGNNDYFFVLDRDTTVRAHGGNPDLIGKDISGVQDADGRAFIQELKLATYRDGSRFQTYNWAKAGESKPVPKITFAQHFQPWDWMIATGVYVDNVDAHYWAAAYDALILLSLGVLVVGGIVLVITRSIIRPLKGLTADMGRLASNDTDFHVRYTDFGDEIGELSRALSVFRENSLEIERMRSDQEIAKQQADAEKRRETLAMADRLESSISGISASVAAASEELESSAQALLDTSDVLNTQTETIATDAQASAENAQTVAAAAEELNGAIGEIGRQVEQSNAVADRANEEAETADKKIKGLALAVERIGEIVKLISAIASQTNLLALNATIEAARAGAAGKGFAVVASEVKALATQTAKATEEIRQQIAAIQGSTTDSVSAVNAITKVIQEVKSYTASIATAVEEQGAATREISRTIQGSAQSSANVSSNIGAVRNGVSEAGGAARTVREAAEDLSLQSSRLKDELMRFLDGLRAA